MPQKLTKTQKFRESQLALKIKICSFARFLCPSFISTVRNVTIWCVLESPGLGQPFKYLGHHHITRKKVFRAAWSWKMRQKLTKTQKFRKSQLALKTRFGLLRIFWSLASLLRFVMSRFDYAGKPWSMKTFWIPWTLSYHPWKRFKSHLKLKNASNLVFQSQLRLSRFMSFCQFFRHVSTSSGSKNFFASDMITLKVFKRLA